MPQRPLTIRAILTALLVTALGLCTVAEAMPQRNHHKKRDMREAIVALEEQWRKAQVAGDTAAMDKLLSDDYVGVTSTGEVNTKAQQLERVRQRTFVVSRLELSDIKVKFIGEGQVAIVTTHATIEGINNGAPITGNFIYTRVYQHTANGQWKITSFEATRVRTRGTHPPGEHADATPRP
jgi:uncharacterized protein (TIGR02246 family)